MASYTLRANGSKMGLGEGERENEICNSGRCQKKISELQAEISAMKKLLDIYCPKDNSEEAMELEATEAQKHDSNRMGDDIGSGTSSKQPHPHAALLNDLVLRHLGSYLSVKELLECRLVCKAWNAAASITLQTRSTYIQISEKDINALVSSVTTHPNFPFPGFQMSDSMFHGQKDETLKTFLDKHGYVFKRLRLPYIYVNFGFACQLAKILTSYFPHVEVLDMATLICPSKRSMNSAELTRLSSDLGWLCLPKLKKLIMPSAIERDDGVHVLVRGMIEASPNLECIEEFAPGVARAVMSSGKLDLVSTMIFETADVPESFLEVTRNPPCQLTHLEMEPIPDWEFEPGVQRARGNALAAVLAASRKTLKSLRMRDLGFPLENFPSLPKLEFLYVIGNAEKCSDDYRLFPPDVSNIFPTLKSVSIVMENYLSNDAADVATAEALKFFLWDEPLLTVKSLRISHFAFEKHGIKFLGKIFPNVTQLSIDWESCFRTDGKGHRPEDFWDIWTVPFQLRRLEIHNLNPWAHEDFSLDSFLTGIPEGVCRNLRQKRYAERPMNLFYHDALRGYPNLSNLKASLNELIISINYPHAAERQMGRKKQLRPAVSFISNLYATKLMTNLCVYLAYDHRQSYSSTLKEFLAPIAGTVTICHKAFP